MTDTIQTLSQAYDEKEIDIKELYSNLSQDEIKVLNDKIINNTKTKIQNIQSRIYFDIPFVSEKDKLDLNKINAIFDKKANKFFIEKIPPVSSEEYQICCRFLKKQKVFENDLSQDTNSQLTLGKKMLAEAIMDNSALKNAKYALALAQCVKESAFGIDGALTIKDVFNLGKDINRSSFGKYFSFIQHYERSMIEIRENNFSTHILDKIDKDFLNYSLHDQVNYITRSFINMSKFTDNKHYILSSLLLNIKETLQVSEKINNPVNINFCISCLENNLKNELKTPELQQTFDLFKKSILEKNIDLQNEYEQKNLMYIKHNFPYNRNIEPLYLFIKKDNNQVVAKFREDPNINYDPYNKLFFVEKTKENEDLYKNFIFNEVIDIKRVNDINVVDTAVKKLKDLGFNIDHNNIKTNGHWDNDKKNKSLAYVVNLDGCPRMSIIDRNGSFQYSLNLGTLPKEEYIKLKENEKSIKYDQLLRKLNEKRISTENVQQMLNQNILVDNDFDHTYLKNKQLDASDFGIIYKDQYGSIAKGVFNQDRCNEIILPLMNVEGQIKTAQLIKEDGTKLFPKGADIKGNFIPIGGYDKLKEADTVIICEGAATGASINKCLNQEFSKNTSVICASNANNLFDVTNEIIKKFPDKNIVLAADNDIKSSRLSKDNAGMNAAYSTKQSLSTIKNDIVVISPPLTVKQLIVEKLTDFNDALKVDPESTKQRINKELSSIAYKTKLNEDSIKISSTISNEIFNIKGIKSYKKR